MPGSTFNPLGVNSLHVFRQADRNEPKSNAQLGRASDRRPISSIRPACVRYPGCSLDTESHAYGYFALKAVLPDWEWSERFASRSEMLRYMNAAADNIDVRRLYKFNTNIVSAQYDTNNRASRCLEWVMLGGMDYDLGKLGSRNLKTARAYQRRPTFQEADARSGQGLPEEMVFLGNALTPPAHRRGRQNHQAA